MNVCFFDKPDHTCLLLTLALLVYFVNCCQHFSQMAVNYTLNLKICISVEQVNA